ncbi:hypothetical protein [Streptomyces lavenduligriseus]|uniref:RanBP2-type domain-containing protein n=1 Tax=Streptomyces lavenduligriseus TaxID=67315 RepID=A0ABT0P601_9ACTN|nr:hypothetical protein [Streptomyces lavenduligriseus]MCL3999167.1 hypothetical protein [Streptomyces lavenduligriseus]
MLAERFRPSEIESLVRIAGALADSPAATGLPPHYRELAQRVHAEIVDEAADRRSPAVSAVLGPRPGEQVWMLRIWTRHEDTTAPYATKGAALAELAAHVRSSWDNVCGQGDVPDEPPADDAEAIDLYYGPDGNGRPEEGFELYPGEIGRQQRSRVVPLKFVFPDAMTAEGLNRGAVFYAADDDGPSCIEVAGVLVFGYLDAEDGVVRVSVHLDSADPDHVVRPDGTVPLRVVVEDTVVYDDSNRYAPHPPVLEQLLDAAAEEQRVVISSVAVSAGLMWSCPDCQWANPRATERCERPGCGRRVKAAAIGSQAAALTPTPALVLEGPR